MKLELKSASELSKIVSPIVDDLTRRLREMLPAAEVHHIGATSIEGSLTKGDVDLVVRVSSGDFEKAVAELRKHFAIKQPQNWTPTFASFGDDSSYTLPVGVQVVVKDLRSPT